jgi:hypothetical protein
MIEASPGSTAFRHLPVGWTQKPGCAPGSLPAPAGHARCATTVPWCCTVRRVHRSDGAGADTHHAVRRRQDAHPDHALSLLSLKRRRAIICACALRGAARFTRRPSRSSSAHGRRSRRPADARYAGDAGAVDCLCVPRWLPERPAQIAHSV